MPQRPPRRLRVRYERAGRSFYSAAAAGGAKMTAAQIAEARRMAGVKAEVTLRSVRRLWMRFRPL
jgi:hypothetical protein